MARTKYYNPTTQQWEYADINPLPTGQNGDILVNENGVWVAKPKWQMIYQPVEWIESTGTQYINTEFPMSYDTRIQLGFEATVTPTSSNRFAVFAGAGTQQKTGESFARQQILGTENGNFMANFATNNISLSTGVPFEINVYHEYDCQSGSQKFDGVEFSTNDLGTFSFHDLPIGLFGRYVEWETNNPIQPYPCRIYFCKLYKGEELLRDFIPVRNVFTGEGGLYDLVNGKFHGNVKTGTFLKGADI